MINYTFDFGGSSIKGIKFNNDKVEKEYKLEYKERTPSYQVDLSHALSLVLELLKEEEDFFNLGLSIPGIVDFENQTINSEAAFTNYKLDINNFFSGVKKLKKIIIDNDGKAACLGEFYYGSDYKKYKNIGMFTIGSGVGGSIILNSKLIRGTNGMAGEFSKIASNLEGEEFLPAAMFCGTLQACYRYSSLKNIDFKNMDGIKFMNECESKNKEALQILDNWTNSLAKLILGINFVVDLEIVYIGGGISNNKNFIETIIKKINKYSVTEKEKNSCMNLIVKASSLKNNAACYGMLSHLLTEEK